MRQHTHTHRGALWEFRVPEQSTPSFQRIQKTGRRGGFHGLVKGRDPLALGGGRLSVDKFGQNRPRTPGINLGHREAGSQGPLPCILSLGLILHPTPTLSLVGVTMLQLSQATRLHVLGHILHSRDQDPGSPPSGGPMIVVGGRPVLCGVPLLGYGVNSQSDPTATQHEYNDKGEKHTRLVQSRERGGKPFGGSERLRPCPPHPCPLLQLHWWIRWRRCACCACAVVLTSARCSVSESASSEAPSGPQKPGARFNSGAASATFKRRVGSRILTSLVTWATGHKCGGTISNSSTQTTHAESIVVDVQR